MQYSIVTTIQILGSLAFFIYGMKMMSEGIQRAAGTPIRKILRSITKNKFVGLLIGFVTTAAIQSSSAVTVLIVSFVNAGLITLYQSVGIIMGANIGTTITTWIIALLGFQVNLFSLSLPLLALGVPLTFKKKGNARYWGEFIVGLAILFLSLNFLQISIPNIDESQGIFELINKLGNAGIASNILFIFIGIVLAVVVQSSSAAIALIVTMCLKGFVPFDLSLYLLLGINIGTTFTAEIAAFVGNTDARRAARIHTLFNVIGVAYMMWFIPFLNDFVVYIMKGFNLNDPNIDVNTVDYGIAIFHTLFNVLNTIVLFPLTGLLVSMSKNTIILNRPEDDVTKTKYINSNMKTPELSIIELRKTIARYCEITNRMLGFNVELFGNFVPKEQQSTYDRIEKYSMISVNIDSEINDYIINLFEEELTNNTSRTLRAIYNVNKEIRSLGIVYHNVADELERKRMNKVWLTPNQRLGITKYTMELQELSDMAIQVLNEDDITSLTSERVKAKYRTVQKLEKEIMDKSESKKLEDDVSNVKGDIVFHNLINYYAEASAHYVDIVNYMLNDDNSLMPQ